MPAARAAFPSGSTLGQLRPFGLTRADTCVRFRQLLFLGEPSRGTQALLPDRDAAAGADAHDGPAAGRAIEILDLVGGAHEAPADATIRVLLGPTCRDPDCPAMTVHQVDVALSVGRQAVERARLEGIDRLIVHSLGSAERTGALRRGLRLGMVPYTLLRHCGGLEHAAAIGAVLAAAQLGLPLIAAGDSAAAAAQLAVAINTGAAAWLIGAGRPRSRQPACSDPGVMADTTA